MRCPVEGGITEEDVEEGIMEEDVEEEGGVLITA
jgi:hypothetical protein